MVYVIFGAQKKKHIKLFMYLFLIHIHMYIQFCLVLIVLYFLLLCLLYLTIKTFLFQLVVFKLYIKILSFIHIFFTELQVRFTFIEQNSVSLFFLPALNLGLFFSSVNIGFQILLCSFSVCCCFIQLYCWFLVNELPSRLYRSPSG